MKTICRILYFSSISFIVICVLIQILLKTTPLEFSHGSYEENFDSLFFFGIPIAIQTTLSKIGFKKNLNPARIKSLIATTTAIAVGCFGLFFLVAIQSLGSGMCGWSSGDALYQHKKKPGQKIIVRYFGCGATDSSPAIAKVFLVKKISPLFIYITKTDTTKLDKTNWVRVNKD